MAYVNYTNYAPASVGRLPGNWGINGPTNGKFVGVNTLPIVFPVSGGVNNTADRVELWTAPEGGKYIGTGLIVDPGTREPSPLVIQENSEPVIPAGGIIILSSVEGSLELFLTNTPITGFGDEGGILGSAVPGSVFIRLVKQV